MRLVAVPLRTIRTGGAPGGHARGTGRPIGHGALDVVGLVPGFGEPADLLNGLWYTAEGNYIDAGLAYASAIPLAGYAASAASTASSVFFVALVASDAVSTASTALLT